MPIKEIRAGTICVPGLICLVQHAVNHTGSVGKPVSGASRPAGTDQRRQSGCFGAGACCPACRLVGCWRRRQHADHPGREHIVRDLQLKGLLEQPQHGLVEHSVAELEARAERPIPHEHPHCTLHGIRLVELPDDLVRDSRLNPACRARDCPF